MKTTLVWTMILFTLSLSIGLPHTAAEDPTKLSLPEGAIARLGKGWISGNVTYSPDGTLLAVACGIGIWLYDAETYQERALLTGTGHWVSSVAFSPDGNTLASGDGDEVRLWDVETGTLKGTLKQENMVSCVSFSPDSKIIASGDRDEVRLWDVETGTQKYTFRGTRWESVTSVSFSPNGQTLASGSYDDTVRLWDVATGTQKDVLTGHTYDVHSVSFSPDGKTIASGSADKTVRLWDVATGTQKDVLTGHTADVRSVTFSRDGKTIASGSFDRTVRLWEIETDIQNGATATHKWTLTGHINSGVNGVSFSSDGKTIASGDWDEVRLWDVETGTQKGLIEHTDRVNSVAFSPDSTTLASGGGHIDDEVRLWDVATATQKGTLQHTGRDVNSVAFSPDGQTIASSSNSDNTVRLWDVATATQKGTLTGHTGYVSSVSFSPDGRTLASGSGDKTVRMWDVSTATQKEILTGHTDAVVSVSFSPDGTTIVSSSYDYDKTVRLWDVATATQKGILEHTTKAADSVAFSPDGKTIAGDGWPFVYLWDVATATLKMTLKVDTGSGINSVAFSPNGKTLTVGSTDGAVHLWDVETETYKAKLIGDIAEIRSVAFSPDGKTLASGNNYGTVLLWDLTLYVDTTPAPPDAGEIPGPRVAIVTPSADQILDYDTPIIIGSFSGDAEPVSLSLRLNGKVVQVEVSDNEFTYTPAEGLDDGEYTIVAKATDANGNTAEATVVFTIKVSTDDPDPIDPTTPTDPVVSDRDIRIRGGATDDFTDAQGQTWWGAQQTNQAWGGVVGRLPRVAVDSRLTANAEAQAIAAGYAPELFHAVSWAQYPDTIHYQFNTGNGVFDITYLVGEHWSPNNRGFDIIIEGKIVEPLYVTPGLHEIDIKTYQGIEVTDGTLDIQFAGNAEAGVGDLNAMFSALEIVPDALGPTTPIAPEETPVTIGPSRTGSEYLPDEWTLGLWHFNGENIADSSTNAVQGVIEGNAQWSTNQDWHEDAKPGHAFSFDGNTLITLGHADILIPTDAVTVEAWVYPQDLSGWRLIGTNWDSPPGAYHLGVSGGYPQFEINTDQDGVAFILAEVPLELGKWSHLAGTYDSNLNQVKLYVNGAEVASMEHSGKLADNDFDVIIGSKNNRRFKWNGLIDEVRISSIARQPEELSPNLTLPTITYLKEDVNRDSVVDIQDLMLVAADLTKIGEYATDVNEDGAVNIADLVLVAGAQSSSTTAAVPALQHAKAYTLSNADVEMWLQEAKQLDVTDSKSLRGIRFLEHLLLTITPEKTVLLANYPNPFNPETWIPYQLAKPAMVTLTIYGANGQIVRQLSLGHQLSGIYQNRSRAAYWDGKNEAGESVASGVYFYTLTAGDFSATRKMLILK